MMPTPRSRRGSCSWHAMERVAWGIYALTVAGVFLSQATHRWPNNFLIFRAAARHLWEGRDLYAPDPGAYFDLFKYSPSFAVLVAPLAIAPVWLGLLAWNAAITAALLYAIGRLYTVPRDRVAVLAIVWWGFFVALRGAQTNALVAALMIIAVLAIAGGEQRRAAAAVVLGTMIKLFPLAVLPFALLRRGWQRLFAWCMVDAAIALALPLLIVSPVVLRAEYRSWGGVEQVDALDRGDSVMGMLHDWFGLMLPTRAAQLAGTLVLVAPVLLQCVVRHRRGEAEAGPRFTRLWIASLLIYVVLFNHQAEFQSYVIAAVGAGIWFVESPRRWPWALWAATCALGLHPFPYVITWVLLQAELFVEASRASAREASPGEIRELHVAAPEALPHGF